MIRPVNGETNSIIINGIGTYTPPKILSNKELSKFVDTSDEWIRTRTGIRERRIASNEENCSDMATYAGRAALDAANLRLEDIDLLIVATMTPDMLFPSTACLVQNKLGLRHIPCFDVGAACSGFLYILEIGCQMLRSGNYKHVLLIGSEKLSSFLDWQDRTTCILFGDGAGAMVLGESTKAGIGILGTEMAANGAESRLLQMPAGGSAMRPTSENLRERQHYLKMMGREIFKVAVRMMEQSAFHILERYNVNTEDLSCVIPHQANIRIIELMSARMGIPMERFPTNLDRFGNTSSASIPLALEEAVREGKINSGDYVLLIAFGAGLTWASSLIKWH